VIVENTNQPVRVSIELNIDSIDIPEEIKEEICTMFSWNLNITTDLLSAVIAAIAHSQELSPMFFDLLQASIAEVSDTFLSYIERVENGEDSLEIISNHYLAKTDSDENLGQFPGFIEGLDL